MNALIVELVNPNALIMQFMKAELSGVLPMETGVKGLYKGLNSGIEVDANDPQIPKSMDVYFIVTDKCTECKGFHDEPQCAAVCPVDCCIKDEDFVETEEQLLAKKDSLHV